MPIPMLLAVGLRLVAAGGWCLGLMVTFSLLFCCASFVVIAAVVAVVVAVVVVTLASILVAVLPQNVYVGMIPICPRR